MRSSLGWIDPRAFRFPLGWRKLSSVNHCVDFHRADNLEKPFQQKNKNIQCAANLGSEISHDHVQGCLEVQSRRLAILAFFSATACLERSHPSTPSWWFPFLHFQILFFLLLGFSLKSQRFCLSKFVKRSIIHGNEFRLFFHSFHGFGDSHLKILVDGDCQDRRKEGLRLKAQQASQPQRTCSGYHHQRRQKSAQTRKSLVWPLLKICDNTLLKAAGTNLEILTLENCP
jgi:hypothetical protein